jgi:hypothetical protein
VKKLGQRTADDHSKGGDELKTMALMTRLSKLHGATFDRTYIRLPTLEEHLKEAEAAPHRSAAPLEHLHGPLMSKGRRTGTERSQVPSAARSWIPLSRIQPVLSV